MTQVLKGMGRVKPGALRNRVWQELDRVEYRTAKEVHQRLPSQYTLKQVSNALHALYDRRKLIERKAHTVCNIGTIWAYRRRSEHSWSVDVERALVFVWICPRCHQEKHTARDPYEFMPKTMWCEGCDIVVRVNTSQKTKQG